MTDSPPHAPVQIYRRPQADPDFDVSAYHWANATSGRRITALWIFLSPFAMANVAGWMRAKRAGPGVERAGLAAVRAAGAALTGVFTIQAFVALALIPVTKLARVPVVSLGGLTVEVDEPVVRVARIGLIALVYVVLLAISRLSAAGEATASPAVGDPVPGAKLGAERMWRPHPLVGGLRGMHELHGGVVVAAATLVWSGWVAPPVAGAALGVSALAAGILPALRPSATRWSPPLGAFLVGGALALAAASPPTQWSLEETHIVGLQAAAWLAVFSYLSFLAGPASAGALVVAAFFGAVLGTGIGLFADWLLETNLLIGQGVGWVAVMMLLMLVVLAAAGAAAAFRPLPEERGAGAGVIARRVVQRAGTLLSTAGGFGVAAGIHAVVSMWSHGRALVPAGGPLRRLAEGFVPEALGRFPVWLTVAALGLAIGLPSYFALRSVVLGWRAGPGGRSTRRRVGILWDLGSFWPRWFHPLAPPSYGATVVSDLAQRLASLPADSVLSAHSHGSLLAVASKAKAATYAPPLLTHGSPVGSLYPRLFPTAGVPELVTAVAGAAPWVNLWRLGDPISGPIGVEGVVDMELGPGGHAGYADTTGYCLARRSLVGASTAPCHPGGSG